MWDLVEGLCEIHDDQICLLVPPIHRAIQVADDIVHKLNQLGFTRPPTLEPMLTVSKYVSYQGYNQDSKLYNNYIVCKITETGMHLNQNDCGPYMHFEIIKT